MKRMWLMGLIGVAALVAGLRWWQPWQPAIPLPGVMVQAVAINRSGNLELVADDGTRRILTEETGRFVLTQVTPAPDGRTVAYLLARNNRVQLTVTNLDGTTTHTLFDHDDVQPFYLAWSPDSRWISFLASDSQMHLYLVPADGSRQAHEIRAGQPSYFAWTPDSKRMLLHIGGGAPRGSIFEYTLDGDLLEPLDVPAGDFQTPGWDDQGKTPYVVMTDGTRNRLVRLVEAEQRDLSGRTVDSLVFSLSPDRQQLAFISINPRLNSPVAVVATSGGTAKLISETRPIAFFWSPDGTQIASVVIEERGVGPSGDRGIVRVAQRSTIRLYWEVTSLATGETVSFDPWIPSDEFVSLLPYFDQYATSLALWSPDGTRLVYGTSEGVISLRISDGMTTTLAEGGQGFWVPLSK